MGWESFDVVRFDLGPLLQGQTRIAKLKSAYNLLIIGPIEVCHKYFAPLLSTYRTTYNTRRSQSVANFLNVPKFQPTIHKSIKQFGFSFAFDAPTVWNSLPEDIRVSPTMASFRKKLKTYLYAKAYPP